MRTNMTASAISAVLVPLFWSMVFPLTKIILREVPPASVIALRYSAGALFLAAAAWAKGRGPEMKHLARTKWPAMFALGFVAVASYASQVIGLSYSSTAAGAIIASTSPIYSAILGAIVLRERVGPHQIAGLILSLAGVTGITLAGEQSSPGSMNMIGTGLMFFGAVTYSVYTVYGKKWDASSPPVLAVSTGLGVMPFLAYAALTEPLAASLSAARPIVLLDLIALGILPTGLAVIWFFGLVEKLGAARASVISYLVPVFGLVQSSILLGEQLSPGLLMGGAASLAGVALAQYHRRAPTTEKPEQVTPS